MTTIFNKYLLTLLFIYFVTIVSGNTYFVSNSGDNSNNGSYKNPFKTIQFAINKLKSGDICYIRQGYYCGNILISKKSVNGKKIVISNFKKEQVFVLPKKYNFTWTKHKGNIYKAKISRKIIQIFENNTPSFQASFPTIKEGDMNKKKWGDIYSFGDKTVIFKGVEKFKNLKNCTFIGLCGRGLVSLTGTVKKSKKNKIFIKNSAFYWNKIYKSSYLGIGKGYLTGNYDFLDSPGEWIQKNGFLYYWPKKKENLNSLILKTTDTLIEISNSKNIKLNGINIFGGKFTINNSHKISVSNSSVKYPTSFFQFESGFDRFGGVINHIDYNSPYNWPGKGVEIDGENNEIINCQVSHSWGDGITLLGTKNTIKNCVISDCNWMGTDAAAINASGFGHLISSNTLFKTGRSVLLHRKLKSSKIIFNEIYQGGILCDDLGLTYTYDTDGCGTEIAYNWLHDNKSPRYGVGIYLDNNHENFKIHHNVIWNCFVGLTINQTASNDKILNNTFFNIKYTMGSCSPDGLKPKLDNIITKNNITESNLEARDFKVFYGTQTSNNVFTPQLNSKMINSRDKLFYIKEKKISSIGAYNVKDYNWKAGALLHKKSNSIYKVIIESIPFKVFLFLTYLILLQTLLIHFFISKNYNLTKVKLLIIYYVKVSFSLILILIYTYYYTNQYTSDIYKYFEDAKVMYNGLFNHNPIEYLRFILGLKNNSTLYNELLSQTTYLRTNEIGNQLLIRLNGLLLIFSFNNIYIQSLFYAFISSIGSIYLYRTFFKLFNNAKALFIGIIIIPTVLFFTSNGLKECLLITLVSFFIYYLSYIIQDKIRYINILLLIGLVYLIFSLKPYIVLIIIPSSLCWYIVSKVNFNYKLTYIAIFNIVFLFALLLNPFFDVKSQLINVQTDIYNVANEMFVHSKIEIPKLSNSIQSFIYSIPNTFVNVFFQPTIVNCHSIFHWLVATENLLILLLTLFAIRFHKKMNSSQYDFLGFVITFVFLSTLFIGWTSSIIGSIIRYRTISHNLFVLILICITDWGKIKNYFKRTS